MYTIVKTIEGAQKQPNISAVPSTWVKNNVLFWPPGARAHVSNMIKTLKAPLETWRKIPCVIKMQEINTLEQATQLAASYSNCSDTESEERHFIHNDAVDLNVMIDALSDNPLSEEADETICLIGGVDDGLAKLNSKLDHELAKIKAKLDQILLNSKS